MIPGSKYQEGKPWMAEPENTWPCKKSFSPALAEEFRKDMLGGACCVVKEMGPHGEQEDDFPEVRKGGLDRLIRVYGYMMAAVHKWRRKKGAAEPVLINPTRIRGREIGYLAECLRSAELFLLEQAQKDLRSKAAGYRHGQRRGYQRSQKEAGCDWVKRKESNQRRIRDRGSTRDSQRP
jgi:hypothetical protein